MGKDGQLSIVVIQLFLYGDSVRVYSHAGKFLHDAFFVVFEFLYFVNPHQSFVTAFPKHTLRLVT